MKFSNLERANNYEVEKWLNDNLELTPRQQELLYDRELVRYSQFYFYKMNKTEKVSLFWRITIIPFIIYFILVICIVPIKWLFTGKLGYGRNFIDKFHSKWLRKIGF